MVSILIFVVVSKPAYQPALRSSNKLEIIRPVDSPKISSRGIWQIVYRMSIARGSCFISRDIHPVIRKIVESKLHSCISHHEVTAPIVVS